MSDGNRILRELIFSNSSRLIHSDLIDENGSFLTNLPTSDDVSEAAIGLVRLQTTFELATQDLAEGKLLVSSIGINSTSRHRQVIYFRNYSRISSFQREIDYLCFTNSRRLLGIGSTSLLNRGRWNCNGLDAIKSLLWDTNKKPIMRNRLALKTFWSIMHFLLSIKVASIFTHYCNW